MTINKLLVLKAGEITTKLAHQNTNTPPDDTVANMVAIFKAGAPESTIGRRPKRSGPVKVWGAPARTPPGTTPED